MHLTLSEPEELFRAQVRTFFAANLTPELRRAARLTSGVYAELPHALAWHRILHAQGWAAPFWPVEYGGTGWSPAEQYIFNSESARAGTPQMMPGGLALLGPVVMRFGTDAQKEEILPRILSGEDYWCQGFSEPGAGSDLAALKTTAVVDGDNYRVNGTKIWTTHAHYANRMFALVRTSNEGRPQSGISFLVLDMNLPGITIRPIKTIGGDHEVNQVFFDDVLVPKKNLIGSEGEGWACAKYLLEFERGVSSEATFLRMSLAALAGPNGATKLSMYEDPDIAIDIAMISSDLDALEVLELRMLSTISNGGNPGAFASVLKLRSSQLRQAVRSLGLRIAGPNALQWHAVRPLSDIADLAPEDEMMAIAAPAYLNDRAVSIYGGSAEIQRELIARHILHI